MPEPPLQPTPTNPGPSPQPSLPNTPTDQGAAANSGGANTALIAGVVAGAVAAILAAAAGVVVYKRRKRRPGTSYKTGGDSLPGSASGGTSKEDTVTVGNLSGSHRILMLPFRPGPQPQWQELEPSSNQREGQPECGQPADPSSGQSGGASLTTSGEKGVSSLQQAQSSLSGGGPATPHVLTMPYAAFGGSLTASSGAGDSTSSLLLSNASSMSSSGGISQPLLLLIPELAATGGGTAGGAGPAPSTQAAAGDADMGTTSSPQSGLFADGQEDTDWELGPQDISICTHKDGALVLLGAGAFGKVRSCKVAVIRMWLCELGFCAWNARMALRCVLCHTLLVVACMESLLVGLVWFMKWSWRAPPTPTPTPHTHTPTHTSPALDMLS
jgi:hypothetical protein